MKKQYNGPKMNERLSRQENRALTRAKLLKIGRRHFLTKGYTDTVLEQVAEEAGFSRGALYSNFRGKEDLFLAVFENDLHLHFSHYYRVLDSDIPAPERIRAFRKAFLHHGTSREWGILRTELEVGALRSEALRKRFAQIHRRDLENAMALVQKAMETGDMAPDIPVEEFVLTVQSFMMGLSLKQRLLARDLPPGKIRDVAGTFFDTWIATHLRRGAIHQKPTAS